MEELINNLIEKKVLEVLERLHLNPNTKEAEKEAYDKLLTSDEVRNLLNISKPTLYRWKKANYLICVKVGKKCYYHESDIKELTANKIYG